MNKPALLPIALIFLALVSPVAAKIIGGPIVNPANGHEYYLLAPAKWSESEREAEDMGGTLALIHDAAEQAWVFTTFGNFGGKDHLLWIGLHRRRLDGPFTWVVGGAPEYTNWSAGNPDNQGHENWVEMYTTNDPDRPGTWNDVNDEGLVNRMQPNGVVEVPGKAHPQALGETEKSLVGPWYESGDPAQPTWIAEAGGVLFAIGGDRRSTRLTLTPQGDLVASHWREHAGLTKDAILWSRGEWWSRQPLFQTTAVPPGR